MNTTPPRMPPMVFLRRVLAERLLPSAQPDESRLRRLIEGLHGEDHARVRRSFLIAGGGMRGDEDAAVTELARIASSCSDSIQADLESLHLNASPLVIFMALTREPELRATVFKARAGNPDALAAVQESITRASSAAGHHDAEEDRPGPGQAEPSWRQSDFPDNPLDAHEQLTSARAHPSHRLGHEEPAAGQDPRRPSHLAALPKERYNSTQAGLTVELDTLRGSDEGGTREPLYTLRVEGARRPAGGGAADWDNKVSFQLTYEELPAFTAVVLRSHPGVLFTNHGKHKNKTLRLQNQDDDSLYLTLSEGKDAGRCAIRLEPLARYSLVMLCVQTLARNHPEAGAATALDVITRLFSTAPRASTALTPPAIPD